jgi:hypothetical protein
MANPASTVVMGGDGGEVSIDGTNIARLTQWSFNAQCSISEWGDSDSEGYTMAKPARKSGSGSMEGKFDSGDSFYDLFKQGDEPAVNLYANLTLAWALPCAVIGGYQLTVDLDSKEVVGWSSDFTASGKYTNPSGGY